jgi:hypothetical protein
MSVTATESIALFGSQETNRRGVMRLLLFGFAVFIVSAALGNRAVAMNYPWCAYGDGTNCGFVTFQQCLWTVSGRGGICMRNTQYIPGFPGDFNPWSRN